MDLKMHSGEAKSFTIPLYLEGAPLTVDEQTDSLIFTAKYSRDDADASAVFQKTLGAGISVSGTSATLETVYEDTATEDTTVLDWDIRYQDENGDGGICRSGSLRITRAVTRENSTSVPVYTTGPGAPGNPAPSTHAATSKATPVDADEIPLIDSAASWGLKKLTWANLKATLKTYFDAIYLSFAGSQSLTSGQKAQAVENLGLVITRTAAEGPPQLVDAMCISGITADYNGDPVGYLFAIQGDEVNGKIGWDSITSGWAEGVDYSGTDWEIFINSVVNPAFSSPSDTDSPTDAAGWNANGSAAGSPVFTLVSAAVPAFPGQRCIVGDDSPGNGNRLEFTSLDGVTWTLTGPYGVVEDNENPGSYRRIIFDGGAVSSEAYTLS